MAIGDLNPAVWRIDVYEMKPDSPYAGAITDLSNLYTSDLTIVKQRNYPDEIRFTLDLQQLENRAVSLNIASRELLEPYKHKVRCYRNNQFVAQGIVIKTTVNLNNQEKNTIEVQCADTLTLLEKRLIHQDYGEGSWADFAKNVIYDAQHEPNRIYNYAWEGDGVSVGNAWFRGWKYTPGEDALKDYPEWEPNKLYSMYDTCTHDAKFWEAKEHAFYSGETFSTANWTLLGILDEETGEVQAAYGVWREDDEEPGPTGTALGGWGGTSSCHMTAKTFTITNGSGDAISMKNSTVSTSLVAPYEKSEGAPRLPAEYQEVEYIESTSGASSTAEVGPYIDTGVVLKDYNSRLKITTDFENTAYNNSWNTVYGAAYGLKDGTWYWDPQFQLAIVSNRQPKVEYPINANDGTNVAGFINVNNYQMSGRKTVVLDALGTTPTLTIGSNTWNGDTDVGDSSGYGPACSIFIFARNFVNPEDADNHRRGSYCTPMKLYSMKIESKYHIIRDYVPCYRRSDKAVGLYDIRNGKFYPSSGTGALTAGPEIIYPDETDSNKVVIGTPYWEGPGGSVNAIQSIDGPTFQQTFNDNYPEILEQGVYPTGVSFFGDENHSQCTVTLSGPTTEIPIAQIYLWEGSDLNEASTALSSWGIIINTE